MTAEEIAALPARPDSVADWEDLLVRLEIVARVVRNTVDEVIDPRNAVRALSEATRREAGVGAWLEAAAGMDRPTPAASGPTLPANPADLSLRFASLRARTFAMVQRRGLEVWQWEGPLETKPAVTVHQLLLWLAWSDGRLLSDLREATRTRRRAC